MGLSEKFFEQRFLGALLAAKKIAIFCYKNMIKKHAEN